MLIDPVKDDDGEHPVPTAWRRVLKEIVAAFSRGDFRLASGVDHVAPVSEATAKQIQDYITDYDATIVELPEETWATSICNWTGSKWEVLVDLWTEEEGCSDLVLHAHVTEADDGVEFELHMVYVP